MSKRQPALADLTEVDLIDGVEQSSLQAADVYPTVRDRPGELEWAVCHLPYVNTYFNTAAKGGDAIICGIG